MSTMSNPAGVTSEAWTQIATPGECAFITLQARGGTPVSIYIGAAVPDNASPRFHMGDNSGGNRFALEPSDGVWIRFRHGDPNASSPTILKSAV